MSNVATISNVNDAESHEIKQSFAALNDCFASQKTKDISFRREQLLALNKLLHDNEAAISKALLADLGKGDYESWSSEIGFIASEIKFSLANLKKWSKPKPVRTPLVAQPAKSYMLPEPIGTVLIIGAWNYPVQLTLGPLVAAISAGNCAIVKPSELSANTSALLADLLPKYLDQAAYRVIEGAAPETTELLTLPFDHIFYTGGENVAKIVMRAAAEHLTPVTLELGGKSPCIVASDCNWKNTPARIVWSKFMNAGQTCVAPDYVIVEEHKVDELVSGLRTKIAEFYGDDPKRSADYGRIINERHAQRLASYLEGMNCVVGGEVDLDQRYIAPTVVLNPSLDSAVMSDEIFGPILPIITVKNIEEAVELVNSRAKPLAMYVYSSSKSFSEKVLQATSAGSVAVNDGMMFMTNPYLPFGGVGNSGIGRYHGKYGFDTLSHMKAIIDRGTLLDPDLRYPPFNKFKLSILKKLL